MCNIVRILGIGVVIEGSVAVVLKYNELQL